MTLDGKDMARSRNIKPSFFQNDTLGELDPLARLLFIGMWTIADFKGCIEYRPKKIKVALLPYDDCDIEQLTNNLEQSGFIAIYSVNDAKFIKVLNFEIHQNPHKNEREAGSKIPDLVKLSETNDLQVIAINRDKNGTDRDENGMNHDEDGTDRASSLFPLPSSLTPSTPPEARGGEGRGIASIPVNPEVDESIDAFLSKVRRIYDVNVLPREDRWVTTAIQADEAGITPDQFAFALSTLLSDKSRRFPVTPQNALDAALNERAKKAKPLTDGKPIFTH